MEKLTANINSIASYNIFGPREALRTEYDSYNLNAEYINMIKPVVREG